MKVQHLSTSLIAAWPLCEMRGWNSYAERNARGNDWSSTEPTRFGNVVHDVCEEAHRLHMMGEAAPDPLEIWDRVWRRHDCYDLDYHKLGRETIGAFLERTLYEREGDTVGTEIHFALDLVTLEVWLLDDHAPADIEQLVRGIVRAGGVPVMSKIDRIDRADVAYFVVTDYKSNAQPFTRDEIQNSVQLLIYDLAVRAIYGEDVPAGEELRVKCTYDMLRWGRFDVEFDEAQRETLRAYLINLWHQIRHVKAPRPRRNQYCHTCEIRGNCPAYLEALESEAPEILVDGADVARVVEQWQDLKARIKIMEARAEELGSQLSALVIGADGGAVPVDEGREVVLAPNPRYEFPVRDTFRVFKRHGAIQAFVDVVNISNTSIRRALLQLPAKIRAEVEPLERKTYVKSTVKVRPITPSLAEGEEEG